MRTKNELEAYLRQQWTARDVALPDDPQQPLVRRREDEAAAQHVQAITRSGVFADGQV
jgi:hypothetical protein